jgi:RNA polymerase sigma-70 factor (ECF subfamily)
VPTDAELPERLATDCGVVHALYTVGHAPMTGNSTVDIDVCRESLRLARLLHELLPDSSTASRTPRARATIELRQGARSTEIAVAEAAVGLEPTRSPEPRPGRTGPDPQA